MSNKTAVNRNVADIKVAPAFEPFSKVVVTVSDELSYTAGSDTGRTLDVSCPWGTQEMANNILTAINGFVYQPYTAQDALLNPAAEIGDGIGVGNVYSVLANVNTLFDSLCAADISAPSGDEIQSEYPYLAPIERKIIAAQTAAESAASDAAEALTLAESADTAAGTALSTANAIGSTVNSFQYAGSSVQINGANIMAGTVTASSLQGGTVSILDSSSVQRGIIYAGTNTAGNTALELYGNNGLRLYGNGNALITNGTYQLQVGGASYSDGIFCRGNFQPSAESGYSVGSSAFRWSDVYAANSTIQTSDAQKKDVVAYGLDYYDEFFDKMKPVSYKFKDGHRTHLGFIAQDVEEALSETGIDTEEFAGFIKTPREDGGFDYGLRYGEWTALLVWRIQKLEERIANLEAKLNG